MLVPISPIVSIQAPVPVTTNESNPILLTLDVVSIEILYFVCSGNIVQNNLCIVTYCT